MLVRLDKTRGAIHASDPRFGRGFVVGADHMNTIFDKHDEDDEWVDIVSMPYAGPHLTIEVLNHENLHVVVHQLEGAKVSLMVDNRYLNIPNDYHGGFHEFKWPDIGL